MKEKKETHATDHEPAESIQIKAAVDGKLIPIEEVPDQVFSQKMIGDGFAIQPASDQIVSPISGKIVRMAETFHAVYIEWNKDITVMIHVGIDTLMLNGEGFHTDWEEGVEVKAGEELLRVDRALLKERGYNPIVSIVIIDNSEGGYQYHFHEEENAEAGETTALELVKKKK